MKLALAMIVAARDSEAELLEQCLNNLEDNVDGIFITITGQNQAVLDVCQKYNAVVSYYDWDNNFGRARHFNFSQVPKEYDYIMWCDADDIFVHPHMIKPTIEENPADAYLMFYLYAFDEFNQPVVVHPKTMIIKNDGGLEWDEQAYLHEDFKQNREIKSFFLDGIKRVHRSHTERFDDAKKRNVKVALNHVKQLPNDPRSYWNLANSYKADNQNVKAITNFQKFLELSLSDDEKYIAYIRMSEAHFANGETIKAIDALRYAIGIKPEFPDAYNQIGAFYLDIKQYEKAIAYLKLGLDKKPPYYQIIVYNPRDYDYVPMMNLAKAYFAISMPSLAYELLKKCLEIYPKDKKLKDLVATVKVESDRFDQVSEVFSKLKDESDTELIRKKIADLPNDLQAHPVICNLRNTKLIKTESSGKDLVYYCGHTTEEWSPETARTKGIGGSEEAVINLSEKLVQQGWNVTVYNNCGYQPLEFNGVTYKPYWMYNYRDKQDATILWRSPILCDYEINCPNIIVDLHDVIKEGEFTAPRLARINHIMVKSGFHRTLFPNIPDHYFRIVPNGIDSGVFTLTEQRDPYLMINTSSPDRSLRGLVDMFAEIKKRVPQVKLKWAYGWNVFDTVHGDNLHQMEWKHKLVKDMEDLGIENLGRLSHGDVNKLYQQAAVFAYPSEFAEIDCISLTKAIAGGAYPITTDFAAMGDKVYLGGVYIHSEKTKDNWCQPYQTDFSITDPEQRKKWIDAVVDYFSELRVPDREASNKTKELYSWDNIAKQWSKVLIIRSAE